MHEINKLIQELQTLAGVVQKQFLDNHQLINSNHQTIKDSQQIINELKQENETLKQENKKYLLDIESKDRELTNLTKVSMLQSVNKQLNEKINYIQILESQIEKFKKNSKKDSEEDIKIAKIQDTSSLNCMSSESTKESTKELTKESTKEEVVVKEKKKNKKIVEEEQPNEEYEDVNGYELMIYKKKYYYRDLETNELYDIHNKKPNIIVGLLTNGKVKFNK